jgi:hypothetical protein
MFLPAITYETSSGLFERSFAARPGIVPSEYFMLCLSASWRS